jgi:hypothetical protein
MTIIICNAKITTKKVDNAISLLVMLLFRFIKVSGIIFKAIQAKIIIFGIINASELIHGVAASVTATDPIIILFIEPPVLDLTILAKY